ncbi:hypothetical protein [Kingella sp. (in: b-proteobacteria)]|uniref:hypothetical protein n=1 Tax=Kingella sp. (in: b-proteobacteria) TaxID=2020713 RepID=UPI0026DAA1B0|nr:hypothetical protein [Kingella sp. (in: b-proteobacteria)]MDO4657263.1 hypothetical protein [Kingella sp. (in: b-proteobacteria)]
MLQKTTIVLLCALLLSGCRNADDAAALVRTIGALVGLAQSDAKATLHNQTAPRTADYALRLPDGWQQIATQNSQSYTSPIAFTPAKEKTVYYFDRDSQIASAPSNEGYYRELLGKTADGKRVVQDFYQSSQTPQTSPFVLKNDADIESFDSDGSDGQIVWFSRGGDVAQIGDFKQGASDNIIVNVRRGKAVLAMEKTSQGLTNYILDDNAQIASVVNKQGDTIRAIVFYPNGSAMFQGDIAASGGKFNTAYCWNEAAQPIACDSIQDKLETGLQQVDGAMQNAI